MESLFIQLSDDVKVDAYDRFCGPGSHILTGANTKSFTGAPLSREDMYNS